MTYHPPTHSRELDNAGDAWHCPHDGCNLQAPTGDYTQGGDVIAFRCPAGHEWTLHSNAAGGLLVEWTGNEHD